MKVKELIKLLKKHDQDREIVLSSDGEGNSYSPLSGVYEASYRPETTWRGEVGLEKLTKELEEQGCSEEDVFGNKNGAIPALVIYPIN